MIVIKIELWPHGSESKAKEIGRAYVFNKGVRKSGQIGDYGVRIMRRGADQTFNRNTYLAEKNGDAKCTRVAEVIGHKRLAENIWSLVFKSLASAFPEFTRSRGAKSTLVDKIKPDAWNDWDASDENPTVIDRDGI